MGSDAAACVWGQKPRWGEEEAEEEAEEEEEDLPRIPGMPAAGRRLRVGG